MEQQKYDSRFNDKSIGASAAQSVGDKGAEIVEGGIAMGAAAAEKMENAAANAACKTESVIASVGEGMNSIAGTIRANAPSDGLLGSAAASVAEGLHSGGDYLSKNDLEAMGVDLTDVIRKHPMAALWAGLGVGVLLGNALVRK